ncbi:hypothetical protein E2320_022835 [Naja naja]|nr:hypothetical protein E2320_022835 [Naja naja]
MRAEMFLLSCRAAEASAIAGAEHGPGRGHHRNSSPGPPFQLGTLYDCRKDALIPGVTLWDYDSLQKDLTIKPQPKTATEIIASDTIDDKTSALDISGSLKATVFEHGTATHVVTAILYGAQAFFVFDREVSSMETVKDIQGSLQLTIKNEISITRQADMKLNEKEKQNALKFNCKFHGDFSLEKNPVTFQDAMQLDFRAVKMVRGISLALIFDAEKILEELNEIRMQSNDLAKNLVAETFPEIKRKIQQFKDLCKQHRQTFQKELARVLPSIREGGQEEGALVDISMYIKQSPFNSQRLCEFLDTKRREINHVKKCLAWFEDKESARNARRAAKSFQDFFSINQSKEKVRFVVASLPDVVTPGASIYLYEEGELVSKNFELPSQPLPFLISEVRHDSIQLKFQPAEYGKAAISSYLVEYKVAGEENWKTVRTENLEEMFLLKDLSPNVNYLLQYAACCKVGLSISSGHSPPIKTLPTSPPENLTKVTAASSVISVAWMSPSIIASGVVVKEYKAQTAYRIRVSAVCDNGALSVPSEELRVFTSLEEKDAGNIARQFLQENSLVEDSQPLVFALPLEKVSSGASTSCLVYQLGKENPEMPNKVILVMGATGCGKTTLINGMINYILGVQWEDNFRFKLIHETTQRSKAGSRTSEVTAVVNHQKGFRIPYSLTIIDTPGFGGTRDAEPDNLVEKQLLEFSPPQGHRACGCHHLALDHLWGWGTPPVLEALKEADLPCAQNESGTPQHFRFNHSALFAPREYRGSLNAVSEIFWKMSTESMKDFFDSLKMLETKSLTLTLEALKKHQELEAALRRPPPPKVEQVHQNSFQISIDPVAIGKPFISRYQVEYRIAGEENWISLQQEGPKDQFTLEDVHLNLQYQFRCAAVTPGGLSQWSEAITCICPTERPAEKSRVSCGATGVETTEIIPGPERRIVLVGRTGSGISATGNTILGRGVFEFEWSGTQACQTEEAQLKGRKIVVVDTPGIFHTDSPGEDIAAEEETDVIQLIEEIFGLKAKDYTIILFTNKHGLKAQSLENLISSRDKKVKKYIAECGNRCLVFNNNVEGAEREAQVGELMTMIDDLVETNRNAPCYTEDMMKFK